MAKTAVTSGLKGAQSSTALGSSIGKRKVKVFSFPGPDGKPKRFAVQECDCGDPMVEYVPQGTSLIIPGISPYSKAGEPKRESGWVIWCDKCDIHAGPHENRDRTIEEWNELVESLRVLDEL